jgi:hypothetical protein
MSTTEGSPTSGPGFIVLILDRYLVDRYMIQSFDTQAQADRFVARFERVNKSSIVTCADWAHAKIVQVARLTP